MVSYWWFIAFALTNILVDVIWFARALSGTLRIDRTNPEKDVYKFEVGDLDALPKKKYVVLKVDKNAKISQD